MQQSSCLRREARLARNRCSLRDHTLTIALSSEQPTMTPEFHRFPAFYRIGSFLRIILFDHDLVFYMLLFIPFFMDYFFFYDYYTLRLFKCSYKGTLFTFAKCLETISTLTSATALLSKLFLQAAHCTHSHLLWTCLLILMYTNFAVEAISIEINTMNVVDDIHSLRRRMYQYHYYHNPHIFFYYHFDRAREIYYRLIILNALKNEGQMTSILLVIGISLQGCSRTFELKTSDVCDKVSQTSEILSEYHDYLRETRVVEIQFFEVCEKMSSTVKTLKLSAYKPEPIIQRVFIVIKLILCFFVCSFCIWLMAIMFLLFLE